MVRSQREAFEQREHSVRVIPSILLPIGGTRLAMNILPIGSRSERVYAQAKENETELTQRRKTYKDTDKQYYFVYRCSEGPM